MVPHLDVSARDVHWNQVRFGHVRIRITEQYLRRIVHVREELADLVRFSRAVVNHLEADFHHAICRLGDLTTDLRPVAIDRETRDNPMHAPGGNGVKHVKLPDDQGALLAALVKRSERKVPQHATNEDLPPSNDR